MGQRVCLGKPTLKLMCRYKGSVRDGARVTGGKGEKGFGELSIGEVLCAFKG